MKKSALTGSRSFNLIALLIVLSLSCVRSGHSQQRFLFQHSGYEDPFTEGFSPASRGGPIVGGVINDLGFDAWLTRLSGDAAIRYTRTVPDFAEGGWNFSLTLRVVSPGTPGAPFGASLASSLGIFSLYFGAEADGDQIVRVVSADSSPTFVLESEGSSYHNYRLIYDSASRTADLWVDGTRRMTGIQPEHRPVSSPSLGWGGGLPFDGTNFAPGEFQANWNLVSLEIPEPAPLTLLAICALGRLVKLRVSAQKHVTPRSKDGDEGQ